MWLAVRGVRGCCPWRERLPSPRCGLPQCPVEDGAGEGRPVLPAGPPEAYAAFALLAYMSTYSWPDSRMTSVITESVTARRT